MYNDCHSEHSAYIIENMPDTLDIYYSGESECMICGKVFDDEDSYLPTSSLTCVDHSNLHRCSCCNTVIYNEEENGYWIDNKLLCEHCYETDLCHGYCHAAAYEVSYNPLIPIMEGCEMRRGKLLFLVYKYKQMGIFDSLEFFEYRDKLTKNFDWYLNSIVQRYVKE